MTEEEVFCIMCITGRKHNSCCSSSQMLWDTHQKRRKRHLEVVRGSKVSHKALGVYGFLHTALQGVIEPALPQRGGFGMQDCEAVVHAHVVCPVWDMHLILLHP